MLTVMDKTCILEDYIIKLLEFLIAVKSHDATIVRKHSRKLAQLGDMSFPLDIKNWYHLIDRNKIEKNKNIINIFQYRRENDISLRIDELIENCKYSQIEIEKVVLKNNDVHVYLKQTSSLYATVISNVISKGHSYGSSDIFTANIVVDCDCSTETTDFSKMDLSTLRILELRDVSSNFITFNTNHERELADTGPKLTFTLNSSNKDQNSILCGPVLNEKGLKDSEITAQVLFEKRTVDMRLMAQHRYKVQVIPNTPREEYFLSEVKKLGRACVTIEMLSNKPNKAVKVTLNDLRTANRGSAFIFYNCARLSVLLKEFNRRVKKGIYSHLPNVNEIDFSILNQQEEWELFYVYIIQFPIVVKNCVRDICKSLFNPQYLVTFLSNLSSLFSAYYRRVRILTDPREHLFGTLHARIYLLKALQVVFHNALCLLNIEPIKEM